MKRIAVIGSINMDYVAYIERHPHKGETVLADHLEILPGGKGANQAFALGRMGASVSMYGAVGDDDNGRRALDSLRSAGVDTSHVMQALLPTGMALIEVDGDGENTIVVVPSTNQLVSTSYIEANLESLAGFDSIVMQLEIPLDTVTSAAAQLKAKGKTIILDPAPAPGSLPRELLCNVDYIKPNESELATLTGMGNAHVDMEQGCVCLLNQGVQCVLASLGERGAMVKRQGEAGVVIPAEKVKAVDTTAAGDSFVAAFAHALAEGRTAEDAVRFANRIAAVVVQREGAQQSIPTSAEVREIWIEVFGGM